MFSLKKKKICGSLEGGLVEEMKSGVGAGSVLLKEPVVGSVWKRKIKHLDVYRVF